MITKETSVSFWIAALASLARNDERRMYYQKFDFSNLSNTQSEVYKVKFI